MMLRSWIDTYEEAVTNHYSQEHQALEQEAFRLQSQPDAEALIIAALKRRCPAR